MHRSLTLPSVLVLSSVLGAAPQDAEPDAPQAAPQEAPQEAEVDVEALFAAFEGELDWRDGEVRVAGDRVAVTVPAGFRLLEAPDARRVLEELWDNPEDPEVVGMLFPADVGPTHPDSWGFVLSYVEEGHVMDDDAGSIDYAEMLASMRADARESNAARREAGFDPVEIVGWAREPHYDRAAHRLVWAKELHFGGQQENTLNYDVRLLGRRGVLSLNAVASIGRLDEVERAVPTVLPGVAFAPGHRYDDYDSKVDHLAAYGIGALVAGKLAAKAGLFKLLLLGLAKAKGLLILVGVGVAAFWRKLFGRKATVAEPALEAPPEG